MRKFYSLALAMLAGVAVSAQLTTQVVSAGVFKLTYGAANDYSFYDPGFEVPTFYVHTWITQADNSANISYDDSWNNSNVTMNWSAADNAYVGIIDLNTKTFTNTNNIVSGGTTVQKVGIVFKDQQNGASKQSADSSVVGPTTLATMAVSESNGKSKSQVAAGKLFTSVKGNLDITVYDFGGKVIKTLKVNANGNPIDLNLSQKGMFLATISGNNISEVVKFAY
ncbi:T9SS type A sorting domain-containing protein [Epilithonimonas zeae]|uniref:Por secretion system C-terminal sorting domain-containing protein n=1 Tax=Epilithonimonas zeae TaxID=1416779 RepID=A0A1N6J1W1_9FLAO|nr:T9SS type A sorting domain-containing protein [Epilithonimonas zeae]SIO38225.1 Por secretion system C-terminal sorting domain-containing protein [Epilithonimonas zeae]